MARKSAEAGGKLGSFLLRCSELIFETNVPKEHKCRTIAATEARTTPRYILGF